MKLRVLRAGRVVRPGRAADRHPHRRGPRPLPARLQPHRAVPDEAPRPPHEPDPRAPSRRATRIRPRSSRWGRPVPPLAAGRAQERLAFRAHVLASRPSRPTHVLAASDLLESTSTLRYTLAGFPFGQLRACWRGEAAGSSSDEPASVYLSDRSSRRSSPRSET